MSGATQAEHAVRGAVLGPSDVYRGGLEMELLDREPDQLGDPQCMPERQNHEQLVPNRVAVLAAEERRPFSRVTAIDERGDSSRARSPGCRSWPVGCVPWRP